MLIEVLFFLLFRDCGTGLSVESGKIIFDYLNFVEFRAYVDLRLLMVF